MPFCFVGKKESHEWRFVEEMNAYLRWKQFILFSFFSGRNPTFFAILVSSDFGAKELNKITPWKIFITNKRIKRVRSNMPTFFDSDSVASNCELTGRSCVWLLLQRQNLSYFNDWIMLVWIDFKHRISKAISLKLIIVMTNLLTSTHKSRAIDALLSFISWCGSRWWNFRLKLKKSEFDSSCKKLIWVIMSAITKSAY